MRRAQAVELSFGDREGSGYLLSRRHVLTAKHVIDPRKIGAPGWVRALAAPGATTVDISLAPRPRWPGRLAWMSDKHDLAIVKLDADPVPRIEQQRFGWVPSDELAFYECIGIGFPAAAKGTSHQVEAKLSWVLDNQRFNLDITIAQPKEWRQWAGLSGAAIFSSGLLVGVVRTVRSNWNSLLTATPVQYLIEDQKFRSFWNREGCAAPDIEVIPRFHDLSEESVYRKHSLAQMRGTASVLGVAIDTLIEEETRSSQSPTLGYNTLIVGPPYIGKTCWAARRAWRTSLDEMPSSVLWFNCMEDNPGDLSFLNRERPLDQHYILVIDDVHVARANPAVWTVPVADFWSRRPGCVRVLWVARDEAIAESLRIGSQQAKIESFPVEQIVGLFLERLNNVSVDLRIVAALESGLDPALGRAMLSWNLDSTLTYSTLVDRICQENNERVRHALHKTKAQLTTDHLAYLGLLPFGSLAFSVEERFISVMTGVDTAGLQSLVNKGLGRRSRDDRRLQLSEHPFQLRRTLGYLDERGTEALVVQRFAQATAQSSTTTLSEVVLCGYVQRSPDPVATLRRLSEHAEWAGVLDPMASAARHLSATTPNDSLRHLAQDISMKLSRTAYPSSEKVYVDKLSDDLRWWKAQHVAAASHPDEIYEGRRLDFILYEEAYIHYLCERYATAATLFRTSIDAAFRAIDRALDPSRRNKETLTRAQFALSNIWVAGLLERSAGLRGRFRDELEGISSAHKPATGLAEGVAATYQALAEASESGAEGFETGWPFLGAARKAFRPDHQYPDDGLTIDLRESRYSDCLRRHRLNAWVHSLETFGWSWLFGSASTPSASTEVSPPSLDLLKKLAPLSDRDSRIAYRYRQAELLFRAASGEQLATPDALHVAAMLRAAGSFEYLGDHLLLAWRIAGTADERSAIAWFLRERLPDVGFNALPKLALIKLELRQSP